LIRLSPRRGSSNPPAHRELEQVEFPAGRLDRVAGSRDRSRRGVEHEVAGVQHVAVLGAPRATQARAAASEQVVERERLGDVVVRACVEAADTGVDRVARGEDQDRRPRRRTQPAADLERRLPAKQPGHHRGEDEEQSEPQQARGQEPHDEREGEADREQAAGAVE
jgi:hypothetical protein